MSGQKWWFPPRVCCTLPHVLVVLLVLAGMTPIKGDEVEALRYRRVLVPHEDLDQFVRGLLPLKREEFERRVQQAAASGQGPGHLAQVRLTSAEYRARLEGDSLVSGQADLAVALATSGPAPLVLDPCNLALAGATWSESSQRTARLGNDSRGRLTCLVEQSGTLALAWSLKGRRDPRGDLTLAVRLPPSPLNRLLLELPADLILTADQAIVERSSAPQLGTQASPATVIWRIDAGASGKLVLQIAKERTEPQRAPQVIVKSASRYTVHSGVIDLDASFSLESLGQPPHEFRLAIEESLELLAIRQGDRTLTWSALPASGGRSLYVVDRFGPLGAGAQAIQVMASAVWDQRTTLRLPRIDVVGGTWQEGNVSVAAASTLPLRATPSAGIRLTGFSPASPLRPTNEWEFQQISPDANVEIALAAQPPPLLETSGTLLEFGATQISGVYVAELTATAGTRFSLEAQIPRAWIVDGVEIEPADMLLDRLLQSQGGGPQVLRLALRRPLAEGRSLKVTVRAHHRRPQIDQWLPDDAFAIARFAHVGPARRLLSWQVTDPAVQLHLAGDDDLRRLDTAPLSRSDARLFTSPPGQALLELDQWTNAPRAKLTPTRPRFEADIALRTTIEQDNVREAIRVTCTPQDSVIERLLIHFRPPPVGSPPWRIVGEDARELVARRLEPAASPDEAVFELTLARPRRTAFVIEAQFERPLAQAPITRAHALSLVSLPAAFRQSGQVEIHAAGGMLLSIDAQNMGPLPPAGQTPNELTLRAAYRYDPSRSTTLRWQSQPALHGPALAWIESLALTSRWMADGTGQHEARVAVHNAGQDRLAFRLPPGAGPVQVQVADEPAMSLVALSEPGSYSIALPPQRHVVVRITYTSHNAPLGWRPWTDISLPVPQFDLPVLDQRWRVHLAPGLMLGSSRASDPIHINGNSKVSPGDTPDVAGWLSYDVDPRIPPHTLRVYRLSTLHLSGWCLALLTAAVTMRVVGSHVTALILAASVAVAVALAAPLEFAPLAWGVVMGLAVGGGALLLRPYPLTMRTLQLESTPRSTARLLRPSIGAGLLLATMLATAIGASLVYAQMPNPADEKKSVWHRVVIPVGDQRQPVGDYVFLEPALYDALVRLADRSSLNTVDWLLTKSVYRPVVSLPAGEELPRVDEFALSVEVETTRPDATVELSLRRAKVHLIEGRGRLDGEPLLPDWSEDGNRLRFPVAQPGRHRIELALAAIAAADGDLRRLEFDIPPIADSRLVLPAGADHVQVTSALGAENREETSGSRIVHLGPAAEMAMTWSRRGAGDAADAPARIEVDQLLLWTVRPGSVVVEGQVRMRPIGGKIREIAVEIDPRLRLLPAAGMQPPLRQWIDQASRQSILHVALGEPTAGEIIVPISLLWSETSGVGTLALPRVSVLSDKVTRKWTAVALGGNLQWQTAPRTRAGDPSRDQFSAAWTEPLTEEFVVFDETRQSAPPIATAPRASPMIARQLLTASVSERLTAVRFSAQLSGLTAETIQHRLVCSPGLQVSGVQVLEGDRPVRARWQQDADHSVVVTLHKSPAPEQRLELAGYLPLTDGQRTYTMPLVHLSAAAGGEAELRIYRQSDVRLSVAAAPQGWAPLKDPDLGRHRDGLGRLTAALGALSGSSDHPPAVTLELNQPDPTGQMLVRLIPGVPDWSVQIDLAVQSETELLDALRLELPPTISGPLEINPAVEHELVNVPGQAGQSLVIRPQRAGEQTQTLSIRGVLGGTDAGALSLPAIWLRGAPRVRRLVALPMRAAGRQLEWETSGLEPIDPADASLASGPLPAGFRLYEAVNPQATATIQKQSPAAAQPRVELADHRLRWLDTGRIAGRSQFYLLPQGAQRFVLTLPPRCQLIHATVEGVPAQLSRAGAGRWQIQTVSERLPQRFDIVYAAVVTPDDSASSIADFPAPYVENAPIGQSIWTLEPNGGADPVENQVRRLEAIASLLTEMADSPSGDSPSSAAGSLASAWLARFRDRLSKLDSLTLQPAASVGVAAAQRRIDSARERLIAAGWTLSPLPAESAADEIHEPPACVGPVTWSILPDGLTARLHRPKHAANAMDQRFALATVAIAVGILLAWLSSRAAAQAWFGRHATLLLALAGAAWLVGNIAPWAGWILIGLTLWLAMRWPWQRASGQPLSTLIGRPSATPPR